MKIAYYPLHYGSDYLAHSIMSIYDFMDKIYILYTDTPSHGHGTTMPNPDSREKLKAAAFSHDPAKKIIWHEGHWTHEGQQRDTIFSLAKDADYVFAVDSDEIWYPETITDALKKAESSGVRTHCIRMLTLWRSFNWACKDEMQPVRVICPKRAGGVSYLEGRVLHFGYARTVEEVRYKMSCHGHKGEWRSDWFDKYKNWPASGNKDLHPTCVNTWNAEPFDKTTLPAFMRSHPYYNLPVI